MFFSNDRFQRHDLNSSNSTWYDLKQVHGDVIVPANPTSAEADGHFSDTTDSGLIIRTADCMPVFLINGNRIIALHIGWRGLARRILSNAKSLINLNQETYAYVGPHIQQQSFALDEKNCAFLLDQHKFSFKEALTKEIILPSVEQKNHFLVSLKEILIAEAAKLGIRKMTISPIDTFTSPTHNSHRRNRFQLTRNHSFIIRTR